LSRPSTSLLLLSVKTWMPGIKPGMTAERPYVLSPRTVNSVWNYFAS
jgi:hypothetical protein